MAKVLDYDFEYSPWWSNPVVNGIGGGVASGGGGYAVTGDPQTSGIIGLIGSVITGGVTYVTTKDKVFDKSGHGNNGIMKNGAHIENGKLVLDGEDDYVLAEGADLGRGSITLLTRIMPERADNGGIRISSERTGAQVNILARSDPQRWHTRIWNDEEEYKTVTKRDMELDSWHTIRTVFDADTGTLELYVDGEIAGSATISGTFDFSRSSVYVGWNRPYQHHKGRIDSLLVLSRAKA